MFTLNHEKCTGFQYFNAENIRYTYLAVLHSSCFYGCIANDPKTVQCRTMFESSHFESGVWIGHSGDKAQQSCLVAAEVSVADTRLQVKSLVSIWASSIDCNPLGTPVLLQGIPKYTQLRFLTTWWLDSKGQYLSSGVK